MIGHRFGRRFAVVIGPRLIFERRRATPLRPECWVLPFGPVAVMVWRYGRAWESAR